MAEYGLDDCGSTPSRVKFLSLPQSPDWLGGCTQSRN